MQKRNYVWLGLSVLSLVFFIISTMAFGFKPNSQIGEVRMDLPFLRMALDYSTEDFLLNSFGLLVSGLIFSGLAILLALGMVILNLPYFDVKKKWIISKWIQWGVVLLLFTSCILIFSGELLFLLKSFNIGKEDLPNVTKFGDFWDNGNTAGLLIFTLLPLPLMTGPFLIKHK